MKPYTPIPRYVRGSGHFGLINRLIRSDADQDIQRIDLITTTHLRLSIIDSGHTPVEQIAEGDTCVHVLWQADEDEAFLSIGGERHEMAPGDTAWIPAGDTWTLSSDQLAILIAVRSNERALPVLPNHGKERFVGHNRESQYFGTSLVVSRWKITEPLTVPASVDDLILVGLYNDIAIQFDGGISMLSKGAASVIRPGTGRITLVPNGLSYVMVISQQTPM